MSVAERLRMLSDLEEKYGVELDREYRGYGNEVVRKLIQSIMVDSKKHAGLYKAAAYIVEGRSLAITDIEYEELEKKLRQHIEKEQEMLEAAKQLIDEVEDERVQKLLIKIYEDELMHHPFLESFLETVLKREMITEEDIWDMLFRDLPTHGHVADPYAEREFSP
jgi:coenzyme F420-reducing hydrogenase alpha subunit